jgi:hypothetical protein
MTVFSPTTSALELGTVTRLQAEQLELGIRFPREAAVSLSPQFPKRSRDLTSLPLHGSGGFLMVNAVGT